MTNKLLMAVIYLNKISNVFLLSNLLSKFTTELHEEVLSLKEKKNFNFFPLTIFCLCDNFVDY